jgi:hypothetical protein
VIVQRTRYRGNRYVEAAGNLLDSGRLLAHDNVNIGKLPNRGHNELQGLVCRRLESLALFYRVHKLLQYLCCG